ncbi:chemotaxis protein CheB [Alloacidobacterium dinghuense]|uniref:protein-glutamate methylesterase n=1 Tax=Alloacidobacterium dinghuense TaxID=2763107 RepID=A0A7G8BEB5_9BACT|nr:chemotaxis protein CheB [Alloacidobacterium dinghuense]QNI30885.1 chemotaxis protein CheB [Alloacidobacterium dinghuense]
MANRDLVVIGASAGGIEALQQLLGTLPADLDAAVLIVLHTSNHAGSLLPQIMQHASKLPVIHPEDRTRIEKGMIYIAPPDRHMIVEGSLLRVIQGPRENLHRPAIDPLFRSAASSFGRRVIGVVLTGSLDDGTAGLMVIRARGGEAIVQDPESAMFSSMPRCALEQVPDAQVLSLPEIPVELLRLTREIIPEETAADRVQDIQPIQETKIAEFDMSEIENDGRPGHPSAFACPDCGGVLWEIENSGFLRFRCRVGHAFTARHLGAEQRHAVETALWSALRALEESASLYRRMADRATGDNHDETAEQFEERASDITENARVLRDFLIRVNEANEERFAMEES